MRWLVTVFLSCLLSSAAWAADVPVADQAEVVKDNNAFAVELYSQLRNQQSHPDGFFFSPASISMALAMVYGGARSDTASEMARIMHCALPQERLHPAIGRMVGVLNLDPVLGRPAMRVSELSQRQQQLHANWPASEAFDELPHRLGHHRLRRVHFEAELWSRRTQLDDIVVHQAGRSVHPLTIETRAIPALQIDHRELRRRFGVAHDFDVLAAHQIFAARIKADLRFPIPADQNFIGPGSGELVDLAGPGPTQMAD